MATKMGMSQAVMSNLYQKSHLFFRVKTKQIKTDCQVEAFSFI